MKIVKQRTGGSSAKGATDGALWCLCAVQSSRILTAEPWHRLLGLS